VSVTIGIVTSILRRNPKRKGEARGGPSLRERLWESTAAQGGAIWGPSGGKNAEPGKKGIGHVTKQRTGRTAGRN